MYLKLGTYGRKEVFPFYYRICYCIVVLQLIFAKLKDQIGIGYNVICLDVFKKEKRIYCDSIYFLAKCEGLYLSSHRYDRRILGIQSSVITNQYAFKLPVSQKCMS